MSAPTLKTGFLFFNFAEETYSLIERSINYIKRSVRKGKVRKMKNVNDMKKIEVQMISRTTARIGWINENIWSIMNDITLLDRYQAAENFVDDEAYKLAIEHMGLKWPVDVACLTDMQRKKFVLLRKRYEELIYLIGPLNGVPD